MREREGLIQEKIIVGQYLLILMKDCAPYLATQVLSHLREQGTDWITENQPVEHCRRRVYITSWDESGIVAKKKQELKDTTPLKLGFFTRSVVHELRTSKKLSEIISDLDFNRTVSFEGEEYRLSFEVQEALGAIINLDDPTERYTLFGFIPGTSAREEVAEAGGWNCTSENKRLLFGQLHQVLSELTEQLITAGIEPWDLGVHQLVYEIDREHHEIRIGILDTEEYNLCDRYGCHWPESFIALGLPAILPFL